MTPEFIQLVKDVKELAGKATQGEWRYRFSIYYCDFTDCKNKTKMVSRNCSTGEETYSCSGHYNQNWSTLIGPDTFRPTSENYNEKEYFFTGDASFISTANPQFITEMANIVLAVEGFMTELESLRIKRDYKGEGVFHRHPLSEDIEKAMHNFREATNPQSEGEA